MEDDRKNKNAGFTLVELLIAVVILAIIAVPLMHAIISSTKTNAKARKIAEATMLAQNAMEEIQVESMDTIRSNSKKKIEMIDEVSGTKYYKYVYDCGDVTVDGTTYEVKADFSENMYDTDEITAYNRKEIAQIYDMNEVLDAFYIQDMTLDEKMAEKFSGDKSIVEREMNREITIDISQNGTEESVELGIAYSWNGVTKYAFSQNKCIYNNTSTDEELRNVYLFFQPMSYDGVVRESIVVRNNNHIPVNIYLIRQGDMPEGLNNYRVDVNILEQGREDESYVVDTENVVKSPLWINTHIRTNLAYSKENPESGTRQINLKYGVTEGIYREKKTITVNGTVRECSAAELTDLSSLSAEMPRTRVYKVMVKVYEKGVDKSTTGALASIIGTKKE